MAKLFTINVDAIKNAQLSILEKKVLLDICETLNNAVDVSATEAQLLALDVVAGTATASKAVVLDANKDVAALRNLGVVNLDAGSSGVAGTVDVFPTTALKGKLAITVADQTGDTTVTLRVAAMAAATTVTLKDPGAAADLVTTEGAQTVNGAKTFGSDITLGVGTTINVDSAAAAATGNNTTQSATVTKYAGTITTGALTTAADATTAVVLTLTGVAAGDIVLVTIAGGSNTVSVRVASAIATTNTVTVTLKNGVLVTTALNGTVAFHYVVLKQ